MSTNFSANQCDDAFRPWRLTNWESPKAFQEMPRPPKGTTQIVSRNNGHLLPEYRRSKTSPWGDFVGTWDLPKQLPGNRIDVPTARSQEAYEKLHGNWADTKKQLTGQRWGTFNNSFYKEGTRTYATPMRTRSKKVDFTYSDGNIMYSGSPVPRKLSPIERNAASPGQFDREQTSPVANGICELSQSFSDDKIPLPQLNRPVYANENGEYTIAAL